MTSAQKQKERRITKLILSYLEHRVVFNRWNKSINAKNKNITLQRDIEKKNK